MIVYCRGTAQIRHRLTGQIFNIESHELDWQAVELHARDMGLETYYEAEVDHPDLGLISWSVWEYPEGAQNDRETAANNHTVLNDFEYGLEHEREED